MQSDPHTAALADLDALIASVNADFSDRTRNQRETLVMAEAVHGRHFDALTQADIDRALTRV